MCVTSPMMRNNGFKNQTHAILVEFDITYIDTYISLIGVPKRAFQQLFTINNNIIYRMKVLMLKLTDYGVID